MLISASLHALCIYLNVDWFLMGMFVFLLSQTAWNMHVFNSVCTCLCVTVGAAPSRAYTRLRAVCRRTLWRRASLRNISYPMPGPREHPIQSHSPFIRHYQISPSHFSGHYSICRPTPDGWVQYSDGLWGHWGWGGRITGHGNICCRTGWDSHGSGETGECAGPHRAFHCECWEMEEQREGMAERAGGSPRVLQCLNKVNLKKPSDQMRRQACIALCNVVIAAFTVKNSCDLMAFVLKQELPVQPRTKQSVLFSCSIIL